MLKKKKTNKKINKKTQAVFFFARKRKQNISQLSKGIRVYSIPKPKVQSFVFA